MTALALMLLPFALLLVVALGGYGIIVATAPPRETKSAVATRDLVDRIAP